MQGFKQFWISISHLKLQAKKFLAMPLKAFNLGHIKTYYDQLYWIPPELSEGFNFLFWTGKKKNNYVFHSTVKVDLF